MVDDDRSRPPDDGPRAAQAAIAALCVLGLLVAAVAAPTLAGAAGGGDGPGAGEGGAGGGNGNSDGTDGGGEGVDVGPGPLDLLRWLLPEKGTEERRSGPDCNIAVTPRPTPGKEVTVTVTRAGEPVEGALVRFDGDPIGRTGVDGEVRGRVPYIRQLSVSATLPDDTRCVAETETAVRAAVLGVAVANVPDAANVSDDGRNLSRTYEVDGRVRLAVAGTPDPGTTVIVDASVEGVPMRNATVAVDGRTVGTTDDDGRYVLSLPDDGTERLDVRVERGAFAGETTVVVRLLDARVAPVRLLSLPGRPVVVYATLGEDPARNAVVTRSGRRLGTTDDQGRLRVRLPADPGATVTVRAEGQTATAVVWPLYVGTALVVGLPVVAVLVAGAFAYRLGATPGRAGRGLARVVSRAIAALAACALWVANALERALSWLVALTRAVLAWVGRLPGRVRTDWPGVFRSLGAWLAAVPGRVWRGFRRASWPRVRRRTDDAPERTSTANVGPSPFDLREAWRVVARRVVPSAWRTRTPGEIVRAAAAQGLPREPVERLAAVFEEVEYGGRPLSADRRERARAALGTLLAHWRTDEDDGASEGGTR